jgi:hypothetical protein
MWMPRTCTWNDINAASTPYLLDADVADVADIRFGWAPQPTVRREPAAIN